MFKLYHGNDTFLSLYNAIKKSQELIKTLGIESVSLDGTNQSAEEIFTIITSQNMFSNDRILFLKRIYSNKEKDILIPKLISILSNQETGNYIFWEDKKINSITTYLRFFKQKDAIEEYEIMKKNRFLSWAKEYIKSEKIDIDVKIIPLLAERTNYISERFVKELEKILLENKPLTTDRIVTLVSNTYESDIWKLTDCLNDGEKNEALKILNNLISQQIDSNFIIAMLARNIRLSVLINYMHNNGSKSNEIVSKLKIPPFIIPSILRNSNLRNLKKLKKIYNKISDLDFSIKTGNIEPILGLTLLLVRI